MNYKNLPFALLLGASLVTSSACEDDHGEHEHETEVITTVSLSFTPVAGGAPMTFSFDDPDGDGGDPPTIDSIELTEGDYTLAITFENRLEDPAEDITMEIADEDNEHQIFFTGSAIDGPANDNPGAPLTHAYDDMDMGGLPVGLDNTITAVPGSGDLTLTLRHLPPVNEEAVKLTGLAETVATDGFGAIGGENDVQVTLPVTIQ